MKSFFAWLASLFHIEVVWVDKGHGKWAKRYQLHPLIRGVLGVALLTAMIVTGVDIFYKEKPTDDGEIAVAPHLNVNAALADDNVQHPVAERNRLFNMLDMPDNDVPEAPQEEPSVAPRGGPVQRQVSPYNIRISKSNFKLYVYNNGDNSLVKEYDIAVGKNVGNKQRRGDNRTPEGSFEVQSIEDSRSWTHDFRDGNGTIKGAYGPWFIRLRTPWKGIGIHGTHAPDSIGTMVSEGCVRMHNKDLEELKSRYASRGMKVEIEK